MRKFALIMPLMLMAMNTWAGSFKIDGVSYMETSSNTVKVLPNGASAGSGGSVIIGLSSGYSGDIVIPETVTYGDVEYTVTAVEEGAFSFSTKLTSVSIPATVDDLGSEPFASCARLTAINVDPNNQTYQSIDGVLYDKNATTIIACPGTKQGDFDIPESVNEVAASAFYGCNKLTSITLPASVSQIGECAFRSCTMLKSVNIPDGITQIKDYLFYGCSSLVSVNIPEGVIGIGDSALSGCRKLPSVELPSTLKTIGNSAFENCSSFVEINIPEGVTSIGNFALMSCSKISKLTLPASLESLGTGVFRLCLALTNIDLADGNTFFTIDNGMLLDADKTSLICCPAAMKGDCVIPASVTVIEDYAFYYCKNLTSIKLPEGLVAIRVAAFVYCTSLKSIVIPQTVSVIGESAFTSCSSLKYIVCRDVKPISMAKEPFSSVIYNNAALFVPASSIEQYETADYWKKFSAIRGIGDINMDGKINVADIMAMVNHIMGHPVIDFDKRIGDINDDDVINVSDIMGVVKICLEM